MRKFILASLLLLVPIVALSDGTDTRENYLAGTNAGYWLGQTIDGVHGSGNVYIGVSAGFMDSTGRANTGLGYGALRNLTTGSGNIALGYMAGDGVTTGSNGLFIHNRYYPTYGIFGDLSSGYIGINNPSPAVALDVTGAITASGNITGVQTILDSLLISAEQTPAGADSSMMFRMTAGNPLIRFNASDGDQTEITVGTSDQVIIQGAGGGLDLSSGVITMANDETISNDTNGDLIFSGNIMGPQKIYTVISDSTLTAAQTNGGFWYARPLAGKYTLTLPTAAAGQTVEIMVADADSLLITAASGDSLITSAGSAYKTTSSVAGTVKLICVDAVRWIMQYTLGTWTSY